MSQRDMTERVCQECTVDHCPICGADRPHYREVWLRVRARKNPYGVSAIQALKLGLKRFLRDFGLVVTEIQVDAPIKDDRQLEFSFTFDEENSVNVYRPPREVA